MPDHERITVRRIHLDAGAAGNGNRSKFFSGAGRGRRRRGFIQPAEHHATFTQYLRTSSGVSCVTLGVSFQEALRRAQADPTRGRSQDPQFLGSHFEARHDVLAAVPPNDIVIDTERTTAQAAAATIARLLGPFKG
jgi:hypothetical protein